MKKPNQELFRLVRFAMRFPGWHSFAPDVRKHVKRAAKLELLEVSWETKQFRAPHQTPQFNGDYSNHVFGQECTVEEITRRIAWEYEAEGFNRPNYNALADSHALVRAAYQERLKVIHGPIEKG